MSKQILPKLLIRLSCLLVLGCLIALTPARIDALGSPESTQRSSTGLEGSISAPPPTRPATILTPSSGQTFTDIPITLAGTCQSGLLVKIFSNNIFIGSAVCQNGSYRLQADLFSGRNDLVARVYDSLDQAGPDSNVITVTFNDASFAEFGSRVALSSTYGRKGANPGSELSWPIVISGGTGPYAVSVDWGDSSGASLVSRQFAGPLDLLHTYTEAGVYRVIVKATDANGTTAYLQLVGVANGEASSAAGGEGAGSGFVVRDTPFGRYGWIVALTLLPLLILAFWLGQRHELFSIRRRLEESRH